MSRRGEPRPRRRAGAAGLTRRAVLQTGGAAALAAWGGGLLRPRLARAAGVPAPFTVPLRIPTVLTGADITIPIVEADVPILPGAPTRMWTFAGEFPGPTIRRPTGATTRVTFEHQISAAGTLTIHNHGHHTASIDDGQPAGPHVIQPGASRLYTYDHVEEGAPLRPAMRWYHDHSHGRTNRNSWMGLMGLFVVDDPAEAATYDLPPADREILLVVTDRTFDEQTHQLVNPFDVADPGADGVGTGDTILVNGLPYPYVEVEPTRYRIRVLNAAAFRSYNLGFGGGPTLVQVGTESGLLPHSVTRPRIFLGPAERADLVVDFSAHAGQNLIFSSGPEDPPVFRLPGSAAPVDDWVMQFRVRGTPVATGAPAAVLRPLPDWVADLRTKADRIFAFGIGIDPANPRRVWTINGRTFDHEHVAARPELGSTETWLLVNVTHVTHLIHIHDVDWKMVSRNGSPPDPAEAGLKETFRLDPGDLLMVGAKFTDHLGPYMIHCHMLSHEDHAMMTTFEVVPPGEGDRPLVPGSLAGLEPAEASRVAAMIDELDRRPGRPVPPPASPLALERGSSLRNGHDHG